MTHSPKNGKRWTVKELEAIPENWVGDSLSDGDGLFGVVQVKKSGGISIKWRYHYRFGGKQKWFDCGSWAHNDLVAIREKRDWAKGCLKKGVDPKEQQCADRIKNQNDLEAIKVESQRSQEEKLSAYDLFEKWVKEGVRRKDGNAEIRRMFEKDILPRIGKIELKAITEKEIKAVLKTITARGANRVATMIFADLRQMFRWAKKRKPWKNLLEDDPTEEIEGKDFLPLGYKDKERTRTLSEEEIIEFNVKLRAVEKDYEEAGNKRVALRPLSKQSEAVLWIMLSTCCRVGEICRARWSDIDWKKRIWTIPEEHAKNGAAHIIYLSDFAFKEIEILHDLAADSEWCFPATNKSDQHVCLKSVSKQVRDRQLEGTDKSPMKSRSKAAGALILSGGQWIPHDLRRTGATLMQSLKVDPMVIEKCLNHTDPVKIRRTYQTHDYANEKQEAWKLLGQHLEKIVATPPQACIK